MLALQAVWRGLNDIRHNGYTYIWANLACVVLMLPIITAPAAISALFRVCHQAQTSPSDADLDLFWQTLKTNFWRALLWGIAHGGFAFVNFTNLSIYTATTDPLTLTLRIVWWGMTFIWLGVFLFTWTFYYEMQKPSLIGATQNALLLVLQNPLFTLIILTVLGLIYWLSTLIVAFWLVLTLSLFAGIATSAVLVQLMEYRRKNG